MGENLLQLFHVVLKVSTSSAPSSPSCSFCLCGFFVSCLLPPDGTSSSSPAERIRRHLICEQYVSSVHKRAQSRKERPEERLDEGKGGQEEGILLRFPDFPPLKNRDHQIFMEHRDLEIYRELLKSNQEPF